MALAALVVLVLAIGVSLGLSGVGGFLVAPLLVTLAGLGPRAAVTDALISFVPSGLLGAALARRHPLGGRVATALCLGTVVGVAIGRELTLSVGERTLQRILAGAVAAGGLALLALTPRPVAAAARRRLRPSPRLWPIAAVGVPAGILTVLAGVGGPLVTVPALVLLGIDAAVAVSASLLGSVVGSGLGAIALASNAGDLDWPVLVAVVGVQLVGVVAGARLRSTIPAPRLTQLVGATALAAAAWLLWRGSG